MSFVLLGKLFTGSEINLRRLTMKRRLAPGDDQPMSGKKFRQSTSLDDAKCANVLNRLDEHSRTIHRPPTRKGAERRVLDRIDYRQSDVALDVQHPGGTTSQFLVCTRNLSAGGLSILHGGFLHPGSNCRVVLPSIGGQRQIIQAKVVSCRLVEGRIHEVGLRFHQQINTADFIDPARAAASEPARSADVSALDALLQHLVEAPAQLRRIVEFPDLAAARIICATVRDAAEGAGFRAVRDSADAAVQMLASTASVARSSEAMKRLARACDQTRMQMTTGIANGQQTA